MLRGGLVQGGVVGWTATKSLEAVRLTDSYVNTHAARMRCFIRDFLHPFTKTLAKTTPNFHMFLGPNTIDHIRGNGACLLYPGAHLLLAQHAQEIWRTSGKKVRQTRCQMSDARNKFDVPMR